MRAVVTGSAGFIGGHLARHLVSEGHKVLGIDNFSTGRKETIDELLSQPGFQFAHCDVRDGGSLAPLIAGHESDVVFHQAAFAFVEESFRDPQFVHDVNVVGTHNVAWASAQCGASMVFASSSAVYGNHPALQAVGSPTDPLSPYAESKLRSEEAVNLLCYETPLKAAALRYFNVFGPRQSTGYGSVIPAWFTAARDGRPLVIFGSGDISRDFTFVEDVVKANMMAHKTLSCSKGGRLHTFNVGSGVSTTLLELRGKIAATCRDRVTSDIVLPEEPGLPRTGDTQALLAGGSNILSGSSVTPLATGLQRSSGWYLDKEDRCTTM